MKSLAASLNFLAALYLSIRVARQVDGWVIVTVILFCALTLISLHEPHRLLKFIGSVWPIILTVLGIVSFVRVYSVFGLFYPTKFLVAVTFITVSIITLRALFFPPQAPDK